MSTQRYGFLGPAGTFTEMALRARLESDGTAARGGADAAHGMGAELVPFGSVGLALEAVRAGDVDAAMVPIENSVEGGVSATLDALATDGSLVIVAEQLVPITFVLATTPGAATPGAAIPATGPGDGPDLTRVRTVGTHPHAWAQVRGWMDRNLPGATYVTASSTAAAAAALARAGAATDTDPDADDAGERPAYDACVCAPVAAANQGLAVLAEGIEDNAGAVTRFVLVARPGRLPAPTGADKTTVVLYQREDHPGGLLDLLEQFATRGINLTRIESRPTGEGLGSYCFSVDCEGHVGDERLGEALSGLHRVCARVVFLGSYPRADRHATAVPPGMADADFVAARDWLGRVRRAR